MGKLPLPSLDNPFKAFYDAVIDPIVDMLGPQDDKLVIVPDGSRGSRNDCINTRHQTPNRTTGNKS